MPQTEDERLAKAAAFAMLANFPRCIGAIDCTHVKISSRGGDIVSVSNLIDIINFISCIHTLISILFGFLQGEVFRNRHGYFSMNVQTISDANLRIQNVVARWPGSTHDSTIFRNSFVQQQFEAGVYGDYVIIGDGGYANTPYLCTPFTRHTP